MSGQNKAQTLDALNRISELEHNLSEIQKVIETWQKSWDEFTTRNAEKNATIRRLQDELELAKDTLHDAGYRYYHDEHGGFWVKDGDEE